MKKFIIDTGNGLIEFSAWLWLIIIVIAGFIGLINNILNGIAIWLIGFIFFVFLYYTIFLVIDIADNLRDINKKLSPIEKEKEIKPEQIGLNGKVYKE